MLFRSPYPPPSSLSGPVRSVLVICAVVQRLSDRLAPRRLAPVTVADSRSQCSSRAPLSCAERAGGGGTWRRGGREWCVGRGERAGTLMDTNQNRSTLIRISRINSRAARP